MPVQTSWFNSTISKKEAPKRHLTNLGGTTLQKVIGSVMSMNSLLLCFKMVDSSTHNHSLTDLAMVEEIDLVESNLGRLEIKIHMDGVE